MDPLLNVVLLNPTGIQTISGYPLSVTELGSLGNILCVQPSLAFVLGAVTLAYSPTVDLDPQLGNLFYMLATGDCTIDVVRGTTSPPESLPWEAGKRIVIIVEQDSTGGHAVDFIGSIVNAENPDLTPNAITVQEFIAVGNSVGPSPWIYGPNFVPRNFATIN
jgi:hypothetical protein